MWRPSVHEEIRTLTAFPLKWQPSFLQPYAESELGNTSAVPAEGSDRRSHAEKCSRVESQAVTHPAVKLKKKKHLALKNKTSAPKKALYSEKWKYCKYEQ